MSRTSPARFFSLLLTAVVVLSTQPAALSYLQEPKPQPPPDKQNRGLGIQPPTTADARPEQTTVAGSKPEIVLQAGISSPQTQIGFSPDGRLRASMGMFGNSIKLWEVSSGRLLRQLESSIPTMGS